jgi:hypothetical protein
MPDRWERTDGLNPRVKDANRDRDRDGMNDLTEHRSGSDARKADSDRDGVRDDREDADRDGLSNNTEAAPAPTRATPTPTTTACAMTAKTAITTA